MLSFEERKKLHEEKLEEYIKIVEDAKPKKETPEIYKTAYKIMLMPNTEKELEYAEASLAQQIEMEELYDLAQAGKTKMVSMEKNKFFDYIVELYKEAMNIGYVIDYDKYKRMSLEETVQFLYEGIIARAYPEDDMCYYLFKRLELNMENPLHLLQLEMLSATVKVNFPKYEEDNIEVFMEHSIKIYKAFHQLCEKNRIYTKDDNNSLNI